MYAIIAAVPILLTVVLMVFMHWPAIKALPLALVLTAVIAAGLWKMEVSYVLGYAATGFMSAIENVLIIYGAILIMNVMLRSGGMAAINRMFQGVTKDARILTVIIGFAFGCFIEGAAGWGTPAALCAPLLISLGFPALGAAMVCLIFNSVPVCFGAIVLPYINAMAVLRGAVTDLGGDPEIFGRAFSRMTGIGMAFGAPFVVILAVGFLCKLFGKNRSFKDVIPVIPFCIFAAVTFDVIYLLILWFVGPDLPSLLGGIITMVVTLFAAKKGFLMPKGELFEFGSDPNWEPNFEPAKPKESSMELIKAWVPYLIVAVWLSLSRIRVTGIENMLRSSVMTFKIADTFGLQGVNYSIQPFWTPGITFIIIALITAVVHGMKTSQIREAMSSTAKQVWGACLAVLVGVAMVNIYRYSNINTSGMQSMMLVMASALANGAGKAFIVVSPFIGVLGSYMAGSNTVSNLLFAGLQFETATLLHLPQTIICGMQSNGGAIGNMVCINNVVQV